VSVPPDARFETPAIVAGVSFCAWWIFLAPPFGQNHGWNALDSDKVSYDTVRVR
jgi:hypothetical protein